MKISVVVCTYNGEAYLAEQLQTLLTQSRIPDEIVISDDASTDGTWALINTFSTRAKVRGIRVIAARQPETLGYVGNFSRSLALATGDLVFLCDQDDAWHPDKIAFMSACFDADEHLLFAHSDARLVDREGHDLGHSLFHALEMTQAERDATALGDAFTVYLRRNLATGAASAFRRRLLDVALPLPADWVHDAWLATLAAARGQIKIIDDPLVDYRQHGANQIGMARRTPRQRIAGMFQARIEVIRKDAERMDALIERLEQEDVQERCLQTAHDMRDHLRRRLTIAGQPLWRRLGGAARELSTGRYARFGTGIRSAIRDLMRLH